MNADYLKVKHLHDLLKKYNLELATGYPQTETYCKYWLYNSASAGYISVLKLKGLDGYRYFHLDENHGFSNNCTEWLSRKANPGFLYHPVNEFISGILDKILKGS